MTYRIGHQFLAGKTILNTFTIIDILSNNRFMTVDQNGNVEEVGEHHISDLYAFNDRKIFAPETQDVEGRMDHCSGPEDYIKYRLPVGSKVKWTVKDQNNVEITVIGYVIRNFWEQHYLVSEQGVSVENRYWKISHDLIRAC